MFPSEFLCVFLYQGGGGVTCLIEDGKVFERAGVNVSVVSGHLTSKAVAQMKSRYV